MPLTAATLRTTHRILPNPRTVTITPKNPSAAAISNVTGYRRPWGQREINQGLVGVEPQNTVFLLATETLGGNVPVNGWWITDDESVVWTILNVTRELEGAIFRCPVVKNV